MVRRFAEFKPHKIQGLLEELEPDIWDKEIVKLTFAVSDIKKIESQDIVQAIKNYAIINLVTIIEDTTKRILKNIIDKNDFKVKNLFQRDELHVKLESLDDLKSEELTKGTIIASNFNFQNLYEVDYIFSNLFKLNFFETLLEFCNLPQKTEGEDAQDYFENRQFLLRNWDLLKDTIELRNKIVHNINYNVEYNEERIHLLIDTVSTFLIEMAFFTYVLEENARFQNIEGFDMISHLELEFGNKFDVYSEIIKNKKKHFKYKKFH